MSANASKKTISPSLPVPTDDQLAQLEAISTLEPDTEDAPEAPAGNWQYARRFYKPRKESINLRIDADILDWLRTTRERYQTEINQILREKMQAELHGTSKPGEGAR